MAIGSIRFGSDRRAGIPPNEWRRVIGDQSLDPSTRFYKRGGHFGSLELAGAQHGQRPFEHYMSVALAFEHEDAVKRFGICA